MGKHKIIYGHGQRDVEEPEVHGAVEVHGAAGDWAQRVIRKTGKRGVSE